MEIPGKRGLVRERNLANINEQLRCALSGSIFAKRCAIRIDKQEKLRYNNAVINNSVIEDV